MVSAFSYSAPRITPQDVQQELDDMPAEQRDQVMRDLYGRDAPLVETPQFLEEKLRLFDHKLHSIGQEEETQDLEPRLQLVGREAFDTAQIICPDYVNSDDFRLLFLRSTNFNIHLAALKMMTYWSRKVELFGPDRAFSGSTLTLEDLEEDTVALSRGGFRPLPQLDEHHRGILWSFRVYYDNRPGQGKSTNRLLWYIIHVLLEQDVQVQQNGIVLACANGTPTTFQSPGNYSTKLNRRLCLDLQDALPVKVQSFHVCTFCEATKIMIESTLFALQPLFRTKLQFHPVHHSELASALEPYGISSETLPSEFGGDLEWEWEEWLQQRERVEAAAAAARAAAAAEEEEAHE